MNALPNYSTVVDFLDWLARGTPIVLLMGGLLGYFFREKVKQILARSLAVDLEHLRSQLAAQQEELKASLMRQLEAYKVSLIAEAEHIKASQDVKKAVALRVLEMRLAAMSELLKAFSGYDTDVVTFCTSGFANEAIFESHKKDAWARTTAVSQAFDAAIIYIDVAQRDLIMELRNHCVRVLEQRQTMRVAPLDIECADIQAVLDAGRHVDEMFRVMIERFESLTSPDRAEARRALT